jgi:hypothetical protein
MDDLSHMVKHALAVYLDRGRRALDELACGKADEARATLRWRNAAFHNFRALDARAQLAGFDVSRDGEAQATYQEIIRLDKQLESALAAVLDDTKIELGKVRAARGALGRYRSRQQQGSGRFSKTA